MIEPIWGQSDHQETPLATFIDQMQAVAAQHVDKRLRVIFSPGGHREESGPHGYRKIVFVPGYLRVVGD